MTYLVMEVHLSYCVVLDEIGRFIKAANFRYEVGQYVENIIELKAPKKAKKRFHLAALGSIAACFLLIFSLHWYHYVLPFGRIYLSVNPDVQIEISRRDTVVGLVGLNEDGELLVAKYEYRGRHTAEVTDGLMDRAIALGFLSDGDTVVISIEAPNDEWLVENGILLRQQIEAHLADKAQVKIIVEIYDTENWSKPPTPPSEENALPTTPAATHTPPSNLPAPSNSTSDYGNDSGYGASDFGNSNNSGYQTPPQASTSDSSAVNNPQDNIYNDSFYGEDNDSGYSGYSEYDNDSGYSGYSGYSEYDNDSGYDD